MSASEEQDPTRRTFLGAASNTAMAGKAIVDDLRSRQAVYGSFMANPVQRTVLIPGSGYGILQIAEALARGQ